MDSLIGLPKAQLVSCLDKQLCKFRMIPHTISIYPGLEGLGFRVWGLGLSTGRFFVGNEGRRYPKESP